MLIRRDLSTVNLTCKHFVFNFGFGRATDCVENVVSSDVCLGKGESAFGAVHPHFVYIIKSFAARQIVYSHSIPARISDISLAENRKSDTKN